MPGSNDFLPFAASGAANVLTQAQYAALATLVANGFTSGTAVSQQVNKVFRQSSLMAAVLGALVADVTGQNVVDDGTTATILSNLMTSIMLAGYADDTGAVNAYVITLSPAPLAYYDGMRIGFSTVNANTSTTPTLNVNGLGAVTIANPSGTALAVGQIMANTVTYLVYNSTGPRFELQTNLSLTQAAADARYAPISVFPHNSLSGCTMSTAGSSTTMSIAAGQAADSTNAILMNLTATSKTTAAWAVGSAQGGKLSAAAIAPSTWYYWYLIRRPDTGVVDIGFDVSSSTPTLPTNYTQYRYIGAGFTDGSSNWTAFTQMGRDFTWSTPVIDYNSAASGTAATTTCSVPRGRKMGIYFSVNPGAGNNVVYISDLANADLAPSLTTSPLGSATGTSTTSIAAAIPKVWSNTLAQVRVRSGGAISGTVIVATLGWTDLADSQ